MLTWISDNAGSLYFLFGVVALLMLFLGMRSQRGRDFGYLAGVIGVIALILLVKQFVVTDQQQISKNLDAMCRAAEQKKPDEILKFVSKDFKFGMLSREDLAKAMVGSMHMYKVNDIYLWDRKFEVTGDSAEALFNARATAPEGMYMATVKAKFVREQGEWKMRDVKVFKVGSTDPQPVPGIN